MLKMYFILVFQMMLLGYGLQAQSVGQRMMINGYVSDVNHHPLSRVEIRFARNPAAALSNKAGRFMIFMPTSADTLLVSRKGYYTERVVIGTRTSQVLNICLKRRLLKEAQDRFRLPSPGK